MDTDLRVTVRFPAAAETPEEDDERLRALAAAAALFYQARLESARPSLPRELFSGWRLSRRRLAPWEYGGLVDDPAGG